MSLTTYSLQEVYKDCLDLRQPVHWDKWVWHRLNIPRERFVSWLAMLGKLATKKISFVLVWLQMTCALCVGLRLNQFTIYSSSISIVSSVCGA